MRALLPLLLLSAPAAAQVAPAAPAPASIPDSAPPADAALGIVSTGLGDRMTVPVTIAGAGPFPFLLDTGAQRTVISRELARTLGLLPGRAVRVTAMVGVAPATPTVVIPSVTVSPGAVAGAGIEAPALAAADLGADGLLGIDTLADRRVAIDMDRHSMAVFPSARRRRREPADPAGEIVVRARSLLGQLVVTDAFVGTTRVRIVLDTGSAASVGNLALQRRLTGRRSARGGRPATVTLTSVLGQRLDAEYTALDRVRIGDLFIDALPVAYADAAPFRQLGLLGKPAMLLGMDAIALFRRVEIDFPNREVRLTLPRALAEQRAARQRLAF